MDCLSGILKIPETGQRRENGLLAVLDASSWLSCTALIIAITKHLSHDRGMANASYSIYQPSLEKGARLTFIPLDWLLTSTHSVRTLWYCRYTGYCDVYHSLWPVSIGAGTIFWTIWKTAGLHYFRFRFLDHDFACPAGSGDFLVMHQTLVKNYLFFIISRIMKLS